MYDNISSCCSFHGILYRTQFYRECGFRLSEGIFYEDHEYATLPFAHLNSILILPLFFYQYRIGTSGQSVAFHNQVKRIDQIEQVIYNYAVNYPIYSLDVGGHFWGEIDYIEDYERILNHICQKKSVCVGEGAR